MERSAFEQTDTGRDLGWALATLLRSYLDLASHAVADLPGGTRGYQVLLIANGSNCQNQAAIADRLSVNRTILTYLVDDLEVEGLVVRTPDPADRRARRISLTDQGRAMLATISERMRLVEARLLSGLSESDAEQLRTLLARAATHAEREAGEPITCTYIENLERAS
jgi:DNA-binding MarR family transcriptional regulator